MIVLTPHECRVLGVLIEKAQTTQAQYPLTLNAIVSGCNQKSNRDPVLKLDEDAALRALDGLRSKKLVHELMMSGSRVEKFKHTARDALQVGTNELVLLAEMLMRGPQTVGELRNRAGRMHPLESTSIVENLLHHMMEREPPLVRRYPPPAGSRAALYGQLLCPDLHPTPAGSRDSGSEAALTSSAPLPEIVVPTETNALSERIARLEQDLEELRALVIRAVSKDP